MLLRSSHVYLANTVLLIGHQVDSGLRRDWLAFGLTAGEQAFVMSSVVLFLLILFGYTRVVERSIYAPGFSLCLALTGIFTFLLHAISVQRGVLSRFAPVAEALLWVLLAASLVPLWVTLRELRMQLQALR